MLRSGRRRRQGANGARSAAMEGGSGDSTCSCDLTLQNEEEMLLSNVYEETGDLPQPDYHVQRRLLFPSICEEERPVPCLTPGEAEKLYSVIQSCDSKFKEDFLETETSSQHGKYPSYLNEEVDISDNHVKSIRSTDSMTFPEYMETESLEESLSSCHKLENKHRTRVKEPLPLVQGTSLYSPAEESQNESETNWLREDAIHEKVAFQKKLQEMELAIGSAEMFLPSFLETLSRIIKACYISASDMIKISMQEDLLVKELDVLKNMRGLLEQLLQTSKEKEVTQKQTEDLKQKLNESESEAIDLKNEMLLKERCILELSTQLQQEKAQVLKASHQAESVQVVHNHLQCQIEKKKIENSQLRTKIQTIERKIAEWKVQVGQQKQQILVEKKTREERKNALKKATHVQKQRAKRLEATIENLVAKIREKEIQLTEALSACNIWKNHHEIPVEEKTRLEAQVEILRKRLEDRWMEFTRIQDGGRNAKGEILGKLNAIISENERMSLENAKLKAILAALDVNCVSAEAELADLRKEAKQQENIVEQYKTEVQGLVQEAEELKTRYDKILRENQKVLEAKDLEKDEMWGQMEAHSKELQHARDLQKAAEGKLQKCQESLLSCQQSCVDKSKVMRELQAQVGDSDSFLKQYSLEEENYNIQMKYKEVQRKLEEMELQNKELETHLTSQEVGLQKTELQFKEQLANYDALTRQLEAALENGREMLTQEVEKITSKERSLQSKMLDLENELRQRKEEQKQLTRKLNVSEQQREMHLKELEHSLQKSENRNQSIQNYVQFLKTSYITMFS